MAASSSSNDYSALEDSASYGDAFPTKPSAALNVEAESPTAGAAGGSSGRSHKMLLFLLVVGVVLSGTVNGTLYVVMFHEYGDRYAFFVNQAINLLYLCFSCIAVAVQVYRGQVTTEMRAFPKKHFAVMGLLDGLAGFLSSIGAVGTPGMWATLLNQTLIPITLFMAYLMLHARFRRMEVLGAMIIMGGACATVIPGLVNPSSSAGSFKWYSVLIYFVSGVPMAGSSVYKEGQMKNAVLDVYYLTCYVSMLQLLLSFIFTPLLALPGFGGLSLSDIPTAFGNGAKCFAGINSHPSDSCSDFTPMLLLLGYAAVNFAYNIFSLALTKHGSASLAAIAYAVRLPLTQSVFAMQFMGQYQESFTLWTIVGLIVVLVGFALYMRFTSVEGEGGGHGKDVDEAEPLLAAGKEGSWRGEDV